MQSVGLERISQHLASMSKGNWRPLRSCFPISKFRGGQFSSPLFQRGTSETRRGVLIKRPYKDPILPKLSAPEHIKAEVGESTDDMAELIFTEGCPCGWGKDKWARARRWGLTSKDACEYCMAAFSIWGEQLDLVIMLEPKEDEYCILTVLSATTKRTQDSAKQPSEVMEDAGTAGG